MDKLFTEKNFWVKDIELYEDGLKAISVSEHEMPGLMALREKYGTEKPLKGANITGSLHMTVETAILMKTLMALGATLRWASCNIYSTQDHAAAALAHLGAKVFAFKGETLEEYWWCTLQALNWGKGTTPDMIVDDGGDATLLIHRGFAAENDSAILDEPTDNKELAIINELLKKVLAEDNTFFHRIVENCKGVSEETTTGVNRLYQLEAAGELLFPAINVNDSVTKSKFDNIYGCRESLFDGIKRATDIMIAGKRVHVCGYGDVGKGSAEAAKEAKAIVTVSEIDPICALQTTMAGFTVCPIEDVVHEVDIFVTATGNCEVITLSHLKAMKDQAIVCNIGHFDNEIAVEDLKTYKNIEHTEIKPQVDRYTFTDSGRAVYLLADGRLVNLGCATGHPGFVMSCSFTNQTLAQMLLFEKKWDIGVYRLPKEYDEEVARLHLGRLNAKLTKLSQKQADYINVKVDGPYKPEHYRY